MAYIIAGLGNPGEKYQHSRHNIGRMLLHYLADGDFSFDKKINAQVGEIKVGKDKVRLVAPDTFMNNSGKCFKSAKNLIVIYDDFNLPLGKIRISYDRSSGGHNGLESIIKAVKTTAFLRIRIGVAPENAKGEAKVPHGDERIEKFILGDLKGDEIKEITKIGKKLPEIIETIVKEGREKAMSVYNA